MLEVELPEPGNRHAFKEVLFLLWVTILCVAFASIALAEDLSMCTPASNRSATSTYQSWVNTDGYITTHIENRQFSYTDKLVLEETFITNRSDLAEGFGDVIVEVKAYNAAEKTGKPLWTLKEKGEKGEVDDYERLYRITLSGCCAARDVYKYFNLEKGKKLFTSTDTDKQFLKVEVPNTKNSRYISFHENAGAELPVEAEKDRTVAGVLQYCGENMAVRLIITSPKGDECHLSHLYLKYKNKKIEDNLLELWSADGSKDTSKIGGFVIVGELLFDDSPGVFKFEIPVVADKLDIKRATASKGISLKLSQLKKVK